MPQPKLKENFLLIQFLFLNTSINTNIHMMNIQTMNIPAMDIQIMNIQIMNIQLMNI